jgi:hypothetical protein
MAGEDLLAGTNKSKPCSDDDKGIACDGNNEQDYNDDECDVMKMMNMVII